MPALQCTAGRKRSRKSIEANQKHSENCSSRTLPLINIQQCTRKKKRSMSYYWGVAFQKVILIYLRDVPETTATERSNRPRLFGEEGESLAWAETTPVRPSRPRAHPQGGRSFPAQSAVTLGTAPDDSSVRPSVRPATSSLPALGSESQRDLR